MQIANMGGVAVSIDLRLEAGEGRLPETEILLLLDRQADHFLAERADADGALVKPIDAGQLRRAARELLTPTPPAPDADTDTDTEAGADERAEAPEDEPEAAPAPG
jgi:hypothetical protein